MNIQYLSDDDEIIIDMKEDENLDPLNDEIEDLELLEQRQIVFSKLNSIKSFSDFNICESMTLSKNAGSPLKKLQSFDESYLKNKNTLVGSKVKKSISLDDFNNTNKNKFISKRCLDKNPHFTEKRGFKPRLPPYLKRSKN